MTIIILLCIFVPLFALGSSLYIYEKMIEKQEKSEELRKYPLVG